MAATNATTPNQDYVPGVCNINRAEIAYRKKAGYFGLGLTIVVAIILIALPVSRYFRLVTFIPAFIAAIGFLQARNRFCVSYAASGKQNATDGNAKAADIADTAAKAADKKRARTMNSQAALIAVAVALILVII